MLDCKMNSTHMPLNLNIISECFGLWDTETMNNSLLTKLEGGDVIEYMSQPMSNVSEIMTLQTQTPQLSSSSDNNNGYINFSYGTHSYDNYNSSDCSHLLDNFSSMDQVNSHFHKLTEQSSSSPYSENYDSFIPELIQPPPPQHHSLSLNETHHQNLHIVHETNCDGSSSSRLSSHNIPHNQMSQLHHHYPQCETHQHAAEFNLWDSLYDSGQDQTNAEPNPSRKGYSPSTTTDIESELDSKSSRESLSAIHELSKNISPPKRRVGRPPKNDKKQKRSEKKTGRLWEFIRDLLKNPEYCPSLIRWENPDEGHFRFVNSEKVAQLWGHIKGNPRMTYEKLSRAMRYYYKSRVFEPVLGRRLVYKFGCNATNWRPMNPNFVQKLYH